MKEVLLIGLKALAGGTLVVAFAVLSDALKPKTFAGLFSAAPSVAVASLGVTTIAFGTGKAAQAAGAMVAGAIGLVAFCAAAMVLASALYVLIVWLPRRRKRPLARARPTST